MDARRLTSAAVAFLCASAGALALVSSPVLAFDTHVFSASFGGPGSGAGEVSSPAGVAVNSVTHDVYVADRGNFRVDEFSSSGNFLRAWGWGVADGLPAFETCTLTCQAGLSGSGVGQFKTPAFLAVDNSGGASSGDVYVGDTGDNLVSKFDAFGNLVGGWGSDGQLNGSTTGAGSFGSLAGIAVGSSGSGTLYVFNESSLMFEFEQDGTLRTEFQTVRGTASHGLAVDSSGNFFKVNGDESVEELTGSDSDIGQVTPNDYNNFEVARTVSVAVDTATGDLYSAESDGVKHYAFSSTGVVSELSGSPCTFRSEVPCPATDSFGAEVLSGGAGIGVDSTNGNVYVADAAANHIDIFMPAVFPGVVTSPASSAQPTSITLNGTVDPEGSSLTHCEFEYGLTTAYDHSVPCEQSLTSIGSGTGQVPVSANISGLRPDTAYHFRLKASNANGTTPGADVTLTTTGPPRLNGEWVTDVSSTSATFDASVNPLWPTATQYRLEYGTSTSYGTTLSGIVGEGSGDVSITIHRQDLQAGTTYHYRFSTTDVYGTVEGADRTFTTQSAGGELSLLDGRQWELVSPPNKAGALIEPGAEGETEMQASEDGGSITYLARGPLGTGVEGSPGISQVLSKREQTGWSSQDIETPHAKQTGEDTPEATGEIFEYLFFSTDLSLAAVYPNAFPGEPPLSPEVTEPPIYLRDNARKTYRPLVTAANVPPNIRFGVNGPEHRELTFVDATPDLSHVIIGSTEALTEDAKRVATGHTGSEGGVKNLYEWGDGALQLVNVLPNGESTEGNAYLGRSSEMVAHAVSADGRRVIWTYGETRFGGAPALYMRDMVKGVTVQLGGSDTLFQTASSDGSKIFFNELGSLREYDANTGSETDLTVPMRSGEAAGVQEGLMGSSEDGSYVYFVATGVLASGGVSGADNLYLLHDIGASWTTTFIAVLSKEDERSWVPNEQIGGYPLQEVSSRVSPDGRYVAFMSDRSLTGYDNLDAVSDQPDEEVYLYDASTGRLACASCDPTGARPVGLFDPPNESESILVDRIGAWTTRNGTGPHWLAGSIPGWAPGSHGESGFYQTRYLSDSGRLFFNSPVALVPQDTNGVEDVYEYEPEGVGSCAPTSSRWVEGESGCVDLVTSGTSGEESAFFDASISGDDIFFVTTSRLSQQDVDTSYDLYDAHSCSESSPCVAVPVSPPACTTGDSCKPAPSPQPTSFGAPASATFVGQGNLVQPGSKQAVKAAEHSKKTRRRKKKQKIRVKKGAKRSTVRRSGSSRKAHSTRGAKRS
jgi:hypothetical protein